MLGVYDFCGHYEWTFQWLHRAGGDTLVREYWAEAIGAGSQQHAARLIAEKGFAGMAEYWGHTLEHESAGYRCTSADGGFRIDMHDCPSKGFLLRNGLEQYENYCAHCLGWIAPVLESLGYSVAHQHNRRGQCWWEIRRDDAPSPPSEPGELSGEQDVRRRDNWES